MSRKSNTKVVFVKPNELQQSSFQPRFVFDDLKIEELKKSVAAVGVLQPILVRKKQAGGYEIIAGERRWRASKLAGLKKVPCIVIDVIDEDALALALVENIQREDLNPIEEASALEKLRSTFKLSQSELAERVGKDRASVANTLRLLKLPDDIKKLVVADTISMGHARALLSLDKHELIRFVAQKTIREGLSVRRLEALIRSIKSGYTKNKSNKDHHLSASLQKDIQSKLEYYLGTRVKLKEENGSYVMAIHLADDQQLNALLEKFAIEI